LCSSLPFFFFCTPFSPPDALLLNRVYKRRVLAGLTPPIEERLESMRNAIETTTMTISYAVLKLCASDPNERVWERLSLSCSELRIKVGDPT